MPDDSTPILGRYALKYARRGIPVFPLAPGSNVPTRGSNGHRAATLDEATIGHWWRRAPRCNIGMPTGPVSGTWVLDIDPRHDGDDSLEALQEEYGALPETPKASTPGGGLHIYWRWSASIEIRNSAGRIAPGVDVRGAGGYATLPPSLRGRGGYRWLATPPLVPAPRWLVEMALPPPESPRLPPPEPPRNLERYAAAALDGELRALSSAGEGGRNHALNRCAFILFGLVKAGAIPEDWLRAQLEAKARALGLALPEVRATIESAWRAAQPRELRR